MRKVLWTETDGYIHCALVRDDDPDSFAKSGIPCSCPDIELIDWPAVRRDLNNILVERGLDSMAAINRQPELLRSAAQAVLYKRLVALYQTTP